MKTYCLFIFRRLFSQILQKIVVLCRLEFTNDNKIDLILSYLILGWLFSQILLGLRNSKQKSCSDKYEQFLGWSQGEPTTWLVHSSSHVRWHRLFDFGCMDSEYLLARMRQLLCNKRCWNHTYHLQYILSPTLSTQRPRTKTIVPHGSPFHLLPGTHSWCICVILNFHWTLSKLNWIIFLLIQALAHVTLFVPCLNYFQTTKDIITVEERSQSLPSLLLQSALPIVCTPVGNGHQECELHFNLELVDGSQDILLGKQNPKKCTYLIKGSDWKPDEKLAYDDNSPLRFAARQDAFQTSARFSMVSFKVDDLPRRTAGGQTFANIWSNYSLPSVWVRSSDNTYVDTEESRDRLRPQFKNFNSTCKQNWAIWLVHILYTMSQNKVHQWGRDTFKRISNPTFQILSWFQTWRADFVSRMWCSLWKMNSYDWMYFYVIVSGLTIASVMWFDGFGGSII